MKRGLSVFGVVLVSIAVGAVSVWFLAVDRGIMTSAPTTTVPPPSLITAPVEMRKLTERIVVRGSVIAPNASPVLPPDLGGTLGVVTSLPVKVGDPVGAGDVVATVSDRPVMVLEGEVPMYRNLGPGDQGPDVARLQESLSFLGLYSDEIDGRFGWQTEVAVRALYKSSGYPPPTEDVAVQTPNPEAASSETGDVGVRMPTTRSVLSIPVGELVFFPDLPIEVALIPVGMGDIVAADATVVGLGGGGARIVADMPVDQVRLVQLGVEAEILSEVRQIEVTAKVVHIAEEANTSSEGLQVQPVTLEPVGAVPDGLVGSDVRVTFDVTVSDGTVLALPVTAVRTDQDGDTYVTRVTEDGQREQLKVEVGESSGGFVAVSSAEIASGDRVVVGVDQE